MSGREWYEMRKRKMTHLKRAYNYRFDNLPVNNYGEVIAENLLKLNKWAEEEKQRINALMVGLAGQIEA